MKGARSEEIIDLKAAADMSDLSVSWLRELAEASRLPGARKVGRDWLILESDVLTFMDREKIRGRPRRYDLMILSGDITAHLVLRATGHAFCGRELAAGILQGAGSIPPLAGAQWCSACKAEAPRHLIRYYSKKGLTG